MQHKPRNTHEYKKEKKTEKKNPKKPSSQPTKKKKISPKSWSKLPFLPKKHCLSCGICKTYSSNCFILTPIPENTFHGTNT